MAAQGRVSADTNESRVCHARCVLAPRDFVGLRNKARDRRDRRNRPASVKELCRRPFFSANVCGTICRGGCRSNLFCLPISYWRSAREIGRLDGNSREFGLRQSRKTRATVGVISGKLDDDVLQLGISFLGPHGTIGDSLRNNRLNL